MRLETYGAQRAFELEIPNKFSQKPSDQRLACVKFYTISRGIKLSRQGARRFEQHYLSLSDPCLIIKTQQSPAVLQPMCGASHSTNRDNRDTIDSNTLKETMGPKPDNSLTAVITAIIANMLVTTFKFVGWFLSSSPSMLAESVHSLADTLNQILLLIGIRHAEGKPSRAYPFGKGRARYIWNLVSAMGIFFVGFGFTTYHGVAKLIDPEAVDPTTHSWVPIGILCLSFCAEAYSLWVAVGSINRAREDRPFFEYIRFGDDPTGVAVLLEDTIAVIGVVVALICIYLSRTLHRPYPDAIGAVIVGGLLGVMAVVLAIANGRILIGVSASSDEEAEIREWLEAYPTVERVVSMKTAVLSPGALRLAVEIEFHGGILINRQQIEKDAEAIRDGEDPAYILFDTAERMVRVVGREINRLESDLTAKFPQVQAIDLEVN